ncbi:hypothetical protein WA026_016043 [Henosepilachna vigintioctopunctata]|uniref:SH3 domain-containing protein n=1 Tax=Henosepilachna vigintioctopunctata TaxID=420089 RepID=A0AAW1TZJ0_9CUCU
MNRFKLYFSIFSLCFNFCNTQISDKRLCIDAECSSPVSFAKTLTRYFAKDSYHLSFKPNEEVIIYSKSAGSKMDLWGAEIKGKRGYIPYTMVREYKVLKKPALLVNTEINITPNVPQVPEGIETVEPSRVKKMYEVVDGTTIYFQLDDNVTEETQVRAEESATDGSNISIIDSSISESKSNEIENSLKTEPSESDTDSGNLEATSIKTDYIENALKEEDKNVKIDNLFENNKATSNLEFADNGMNESKLNQEKDKFKSGQLYEMKNNLMNDHNHNTEELKDDDKLKEIIQEQSSGSSQSDSEETGNYSGILGNIIEIMKDAIDAKDNVEDKEIVEETSFEKKINEDINVDKTEKDYLKSPVLIESNAGEVNKLESLSEEQSLYNSYITPESIIQNKDELAKNKMKIKALDEHVDNGEIDLNTENFQESKLDQVKDLISDSSEYGHGGISSTLENYNEHLIEDTKVQSSMEINGTDNNSELIDQNIPSSTESIIITTPAQNPTFTSISSQPQIETGLVNASNAEEVEQFDGISNTYQTTDPPITIDESNQTLEVESSYKKLDSENIETTEEVRSNEVKPDYSIIAESKDKQGVNLKDDQTENLYYTSEKHEEMEQNDEYKDIEKRRVSSDMFFGLQSNSESNKKVSSLNYDQLSSKHSEIEVITGNFNDTVSEKLKDNMEYEIRNREHKDQEDEHKIHDKNSEILQDMNSYDDQNDSDLKDISSNQEKINAKNFEKVIVNDDQLDNGLYGTLTSLPILTSEFCLYLITTAISVIIFLLGYFALDKSRREAPLVAKINKLEKEFLILLKEKELLAEEIENGVQNSEPVNSPDFLNLQKQYEDVIKEKEALKVEIQTLEKELENSTEVGLELNRMLSDILSSENAGSILMSNIEKLQAQLVEQQGIVSSMKEMLSLKETENHELHLELEIANKKVVELQSEIDRLLLNVIKLEEEKESQENNYEVRVKKLKMEIDSLTTLIESNEKEYTEKVDDLKNKLYISERNLQIKIKEFDGMKLSMQEIKNMKNGNTLDSLLEVNSVKAELEQLKTECNSCCEKLRLEQQNNAVLEKKVKSTEDEADAMKKRYDEIDKAKLELETKLQVLTTYFKDKEAQLQRELSKYESMWSAKQGEATSTSERIKYLQSEVQNYKMQNESLKQEIVSQEVELKSQISVLEKKVHENWVTARQAERRLEDLKQEAAHLRNRLTLSERALQEDKIHNRIQSPLDQKIDLPVSPLHLESPSSPLLYDSRDHITKSPPILGMPPPFLPPPPGNPFLPPPHLPFMPPPLPDMFPGDRRPPPLGRMSSPPLNSRYSPDRRSYSPYERRSPSPSYDESEYGTSPVRHRRYSPFNNRVDHRRMGRMNGRSGELSSGSGNSNESLNGHTNAKV